MRRFIPALLKVLSSIGKALAAFAKGKDLPVFALFLLLAYFFWWSRAMSGSYEYDLQYDLSLTGLTENQRINQDLTPSIRVTVGGKGSAIWKERNKKNHLLTLDASAFNGFSATGGRAALSTDALIETLSSQIPPSLSIKDISPDTIAFGFFVEQKIKVPVQLDAVMSPEGQYRTEIVLIEPDSIVIGVPVNSVESFKSVSTEKVNIKVNADAVTVPVSLVAPEGTVLYTDKVNVKVLAAQYTEKTLNIPVIATGEPSGKVLKLFPPRVTATFNVRIDDFENVSEADFVVGVDYGDVDFNSDRVEPLVLQSPLGTDNVRLSPQLLEYLVETISVE